MTEQSSERHERGVAPAVGVLLMLGITVLLAATTGAMVFGIAESEQSNPPQAAFAFDYDADGHRADNLTISHASGPGIPAEELQVVVTEAHNAGGKVTVRERWSDLAAGDTGAVSAGMSVTVSKQTLGYSELSLRGARTKVVWRDPATRQSIVLAEWEATGR